MVAADGDQRTREGIQGFLRCLHSQHALLALNLVSGCEVSRGDCRECLAPCIGLRLYTGLRATLYAKVKRR